MKSMKQEKQQEIALMRYGAIAPIIAGLDERYPSKTAFYTEISAKGLMGPDGKLHHYAPATIEKWYLDYQNHGFEGLVPKGRSDAGMSRISLILHILLIILLEFLHNGLSIHSSFGRSIHIVNV